jgi:hypothetical protein
MDHSGAGFFFGEVEIGRERESEGGFWRIFMRGRVRGRGFSEL